jgi:hypothetical protein
MARKKQAVATAKTQNIPAQVAEPVSVPVRYATYAELESLVASINNKFAHVDGKSAETLYRLETLLKTLCQNGSVSYSSFVKGLRQFNAFSKKVDALKTAPKLSDRIREAIAYNDSLDGTDEFRILADDIDILKDVVNADSISAENYALCAKLDSTDLFRELLRKFQPKS